MSSSSYSFNGSVSHVVIGPGDGPGPAHFARDLSNAAEAHARSAQALATAKADARAKASYNDRVAQDADAARVHLARLAQGRENLLHELAKGSNLEALSASLASNSVATAAWLEEQRVKSIAASRADIDSQKAQSLAVALQSNHEEVGRTLQVCAARAAANPVARRAPVVTSPAPARLSDSVAHSSGYADAGAYRRLQYLSALPGPARIAIEANPTELERALSLVQSGQLGEAISVAHIALYAMPATNATEASGPVPVFELDAAPRTEA